MTMVETNIIIRNERYKVLVMENKDGYNVSFYRWVNINCNLIQKEHADSLDQASSLLAAFVKSVG